MAGDTAATEEAVKSGGRIGLIGLAILCVASVSASFAGAYLFGGTPTTGGTHASADTVEPKDWNEPLVDKDLDFVPLKELTISIGGGETSRFVKMQLSVITPPGEAKSVKGAEAMLLDAFTDYLRSVNPEDFENPAFYRSMKYQLSRRAEIILGSAGSHGILITEFLLR